MTEKEKLIKYLEDKIKECDELRKLHKEYSISEERLTSKYYTYQDILERVKNNNYENNNI